jgi:hypothetical protein
MAGQNILSQNVAHQATKSVNAQPTIGHARLQEDSGLIAQLRVLITQCGSHVTSQRLCEWADTVQFADAAEISLAGVEDK